MNNLETPCFVIDYQSLVCNISVFKQALGKRFMHNVLGYSVKTNSIPSLLDLIKECGCYAEVVSENGKGTMMFSIRFFKTKYYI